MALAEDLLTLKNNVKTRVNIGYIISIFYIVKNIHKKYAYIIYQDTFFVVCKYIIFICIKPQKRKTKF